MGRSIFAIFVLVLGSSFALASSSSLTDFQPSSVGSAYGIVSRVRSVELFNVTRQESVWKGMQKTNEQGEMVAMEVYSNAEGYPVRSGETYRVRSVYQNPTDQKIDAMAGLFIFYSLDEPDPSNP